MASRLDEPKAEGLARAARDGGGLPGIDVAAALRRLGGDGPLLDRLLRNLVRDWADLPERLQSLRAQGDLAAARRAAHTLKGASGSLGAMELADAAGALELALGGADAAAVEPALLLLHERLAAVGATIAAHLPPPPEENGRAASLLPAGDVGAVLAELETLLARRNLRARALLAGLRGEALPEPCRAPFDQMVACVDRLDYAAAELALAQLRERFAAPEGPR